VRSAPISAAFKSREAVLGGRLEAFRTGVLADLPARRDVSRELDGVWRQGRHRSTCETGGDKAVPASNRRQGKRSPSVTAYVAITNSRAGSRRRAFMTDDEIRAEIARQIHNTLALLATKLRDTAQNHGPVIAKALI
jgi:hypothetical protein